MEYCRTEDYRNVALRFIRISNGDLGSVGSGTPTPLLVARSLSAKPLPGFSKKQKREQQNPEFTNAVQRYG